MALNAIDVETLRPPLKDTVVDIVLSGRVGEGETQGQLGQVLVLVMIINELL